MTIVLVHGSGRSGGEAWPEQAHLARAAFLTMPGYGDDEPVSTDMSAWVDRILQRDGELHLVGHSYGGIAAILAAAAAPDRVRSLTVFEPAAYSYSRGLPHTEAAIERVGPVMAGAMTMTSAEYLVAFVAALTGEVVGVPQGPTERRAAERMRLLAAPWSHDLPIDVLAAVPTQVLTGDWNDEYEEIAGVMLRAGARHRVLAGFGHRVQDHPDATAAILSWATGHP